MFGKPLTVILKFLKYATASQKFNDCLLSVDL